MRAAKIRRIDVGDTEHILREALRADRAGQWSIRINERWRICFRWSDGEAHDVEIVDYH
jgi:plasmid maintenance system killer protein